MKQPPLIVVGVDFSDSSLAAFHEAGRLAAALGARLQGVHVLEGFGTQAWEPDAAARRWLDEAGLDMEALVLRRGLAWVELVRYAADVSATLVVAGSHGDTGYQPVSLGSTAARLAVLSPYPVLLVSLRARSSGPAGPEPKSAGERDAAAGPPPPEPPFGANGAVRRSARGHGAGPFPGAGPVQRNLLAEEDRMSLWDRAGMFVVALLAGASPVLAARLAWHGVDYVWFPPVEP